jgi:hypothetical protein
VRNIVRLLSERRKPLSYGFGWRKACITGSGTVVSCLLRVDILALSDTKERSLETLTPVQLCIGPLGAVTGFLLMLNPPGITLQTPRVYLLHAGVVNVDKALAVELPLA